MEQQQQNYIQLSEISNNELLSTPKSPSLSHQVHHNAIASNNQAPFISYPPLPSYIISPPTNNILSPITDLQSRFVQASNSMSNPMMFGVNPNIQIPMSEIPEIREHTIYNKNELYKIQSSGSQLALCPSCSKYVQTTVQNKPGVGAYFTGSILAIAGCWAGCCLVPCFIKDCQDSIHYCSICNRELGKKKFLRK